MSECPSFDRSSYSDEEYKNARDNTNIDDHKDSLYDIMDKLGIESCKRVTAGGVTFLPPGAIAMDAAIGCEKLVVMSTNITTAQRALSCRMKEVQNLKQTNVESLVTVNIVTDDLTADGSLNVNVHNSVKAVSFASFSVDDKNQMSSVLKNLASTIKDVTQKEIKKGFGAASSDGQKSISQFNASTEQFIEAGDMSKIVNKSLNDFFGKTVVNIKLSKVKVGRDVNITVDNILEACATDMISNTLKSIFTTEAKNAVSETFKLSQSSESTGFDLNFGIFGAIFLFFFALVAYGIYKMRNSLMIFKSLMGMMIGIGLILMLVGTLGIVMDWFSTMISGVLMGVGVICLVYAFYLYRTQYRTRKEQTTNATNNNIVN